MTTLTGQYMLLAERMAAQRDKAVDENRRLHDALLGLIEAVELDSDEGGKGISGYTAARLSDARAALHSPQAIEDVPNG